MFEKELKLADEKVQQFNRKLQKLQKEREDAEAITLELTVDLVEQHAIGENIGQFGIFSVTTQRILEFWTLRITLQVYMLMLLSRPYDAIWSSNVCGFKVTSKSRKRECWDFSKYF